MRRNNLEHTYDETDREILASLRAFEATELLSVQPLFWAEDPHWPRRAKANAPAAWVFFLVKHLSDGAVQDMRTAGEWYGRATVPRWVNDLCCVLRTSRREYKTAYDAGSLSPLTYEQEEAVQLVSRAVRSAQRAPAFRITLAAKCAELRAANCAKFPSVEGDALVPLGRAVRVWLQARDWSDTRPGALLR